MLFLHLPSQGVQLSQQHQPSSHCTLPQNSQNPQKPLAEISSHRWHRCAQIFLTEIFSHGLHRTRRILVHPVCAIVGGYGILPYPRRHQTIFPQKPQNLTQPNHLWASVKSVGGSSTPEISVNSVNSVGEPYAPKPSVCICAICGRIIKWAAWVWQGCHTLLSVHSVGEHASPGGKNKEGMAECHALLR